MNEPALSLLERILAAANPDSGGDATWQLTSSGTVQVGPRSRLNKFKRLQIYAIDDLVREIPNYTEHPTIDLQQALQTGRGNGSGSPIREKTAEGASVTPSVRERNTQDLVSLIRDLIEPEQWNENGGSGGTIRLYRGALIINAPDYIHRAIGGCVRVGSSRIQQ